MAISVLSLHKLKQNQSHSERFLATLLSLKDIQFYNLLVLIRSNCDIVASNNEAPPISLK